MKSIQSTLMPHLNRPIIIGEYPYYRASPQAWYKNLKALKSMGIDIISFYLPWRFHEISDKTGQLSFDFIGQTNQQRNVRLLLNMIYEIGLSALLKPGPFIHAEVQLGGLPDRICNAEQYAPSLGLWGKAITSQGKPLPSFFDPQLKNEVEKWLQAVSQEVISPCISPNGPVVAVQLGNEGIYSDAALPLSSQDAGSVALQAFISWLSSNNEELVPIASKNSLHWPAHLEQLWSRWTGIAIVNHWQFLASLLPPNIPKLVNIPLAPISDLTRSLDAWGARCLAFSQSKYLWGHTEWIGNIAVDDNAMAGHLFGIRLNKSEVVEANWGFTWNDKSFADAHVPLFHALFNLMLGSSTCSIYTACSTESWKSEINLDPESLIQEGSDPKLFDPPYCPGAPLTESNSPGPNEKGFKLLSEFLDLFGAKFFETELRADAVLVIDPIITEIGAWVKSDSPSMFQYVAKEISRLWFKSNILIDPVWLSNYEHNSLVVNGSINHFTSKSEINLLLEELVKKSAAHKYKSLNYKVGILHRCSNKKSINIYGFFNSSDKADVVFYENNSVKWSLSMPPASAVITLYENQELIAWIATPNNTKLDDIALSSPNYLIKYSDFFGRVGNLK